MKAHSEQPGSRPGRAGFTLVELLVVVAIIALLAGIAATGYSKMKGGASRVQCASNLRQLGTVVALYMAEHNDSFPPYIERTPDGNRWFFGLEQGGWSDGEGRRKLDIESGPLGPYLAGVGGIERCPAFDYGSAGWKAKYTTPSWGYGYNWRLGGGFNQKPKQGWQIRNSGETILFGDCAQINTFQPPASPDNPMLEEFYIINETYKTVHFRHGGKANMLFVDGKVRAFEPEPGTLDARMPGQGLGRITPSGSLRYLEDE